MELLLILFMIGFGWVIYRVWTRIFQTRGYRNRQRRKYARDYPWVDKFWGS